MPQKDRMIDTDRFDTQAFVDAAAPAIGLVLDPARGRAVAEALRLIARIGAPALAIPLAPEDQPAPVFTP
jgi:hypothetical protein